MHTRFTRPEGTDNVYTFLALVPACEACSCTLDPAIIAEYRANHYHGSTDFPAYCTECAEANVRATGYRLPLPPCVSLAGSP